MDLVDRAAACTELSIAASVTSNSAIATATAAGLPQTAVAPAGPLPPPEAHHRPLAEFRFGREPTRRIDPHQGVPLPSATRQKKSSSKSSATRRRKKQQEAPEDAFCPHCHLLIERKVGEEFPQEPVRCPHCRLLVGTGRARPTPSAEPGARGSAAGVFAHEAKRAGGDADASKEDVRRAIRQVAEDAGERPERLLMVDYQQRTSDDEKLPALSDVFAAYGSWKRARRAAAESA
jgi:hypothetical protein